MSEPPLLINQGFFSQCMVLYLRGLSTLNTRDVVSNEEAVAMIKDTVKEPSMCAKRLGSEAMTRMSGDNITVVVAFLKDVSTAEVVTWERAF